MRPVFKAFGLAVLLGFPTFAMTEDVSPRERAREQIVIRASMAQLLQDL